VNELHLTQDPEADGLLTRDPLALLIGMVLDQQIPLERAFRSPLDLRDRLGGVLDPGAIATMDPDALAVVFSAKPALHRFPGSMARRVQELCRLVEADFGGNAAAIWETAPDGPTLLARVKALPGFGEQKARIFVALIGKQLGIRPTGWEAASAPFGAPGTYQSIADIDSPESLAKVRHYKQQVKQQVNAAATSTAAAPGPR